MYAFLGSLFLLFGLPAHRFSLIFCMFLLSISLATIYPLQPPHLPAQHIHSTWFLCFSIFPFNTFHFSPLHLLQSRVGETRGRRWRGKNCLFLTAENETQKILHKRLVIKQKHPTSSLIHTPTVKRWLLWVVMMGRGGEEEEEEEGREEKE